MIQIRLDSPPLSCQQNHDTETAASGMLMLCRLGDTTFDYSRCLEDVSLVDKVHQLAFNYLVWCAEVYTNSRVSNRL